MDEDLPEHHYIGFFTATILRWQNLLSPEKYKNLIIKSLDFLVEKKRAKIYGFVIMPNHIHILWKIQPPHELKDVQRDFLKFTAQKISQDLKKYHPAVLSFFKAKASDRKYQFWQKQSRNALYDSREVIEQKLDYIHNNPFQGKWMLANSLDEYPYSSYRFYEYDDDTYNFLSHYMEVFE
ncbi:transposase [uncultured Microscilla sp.]|uniref:transposase n=1 Tax=uncultured Microscilla sp. TaxID=432653 RepID=UPI00261E9E6A|nr:transposase [uncultured Microscilla sp.]